MYGNTLTGRQDRIINATLHTFLGSRKFETAMHFGLSFNQDTVKSLHNSCERSLRRGDICRLICRHLGICCNKAFHITIGSKLPG